MWRGGSMHIDSIFTLLSHQVDNSLLLIRRPIREPRRNKKQRSSHEGSHWSWSSSKPRQRLIGLFNNLSNMHLCQSYYNPHQCMKSMPMTMTQQLWSMDRSEVFVDGVDYICRANAYSSGGTEEGSNLMSCNDGKFWAPATAKVSYHTKYHT